MSNHLQLALQTAKQHSDQEESVEAIAILRSLAVDLHTDVPSQVVFDLFYLLSLWVWLMEQWQAGIEAYEQAIALIKAIDPMLGKA